MRNRSIVPTALGISVLLSGCVQATEPRVAGSAEYPVTVDAIGNTTGSITEVREALTTDTMRTNVHDNLDTILTLSEDLNTPFEFERDLYVCEELHPTPADHGPEHPESVPLAACIEDTFTAHQIDK